MASRSKQPIVAVVPVREGEVPAGGFECAAEAVATGAARVIVIGSGAAEAAAEFSGIAEMVEVVEVEAFAPGAWAAALATELRGAAGVVLPRSPDGRDLAPRLAAELGWPLLAAAVRISRREVVTVSHGGQVQRTIQVDRPFVATLEPGVRGFLRHPGRALRIEALSIAFDPTGSETKTVEIRPPDAATIDLAEARRIVGAGAGLMSASETAGDVDAAHVAERIEALRRVGVALGASLGATRVVTDAGYLDHDRQIGTTGVVVDPELYLAFGVSGAVQHTAGLGHPNHIVSVNTDPHCPMMGMADLAVVADAPAVIAELARRLDAAETVTLDEAAAS